MCRWQLFAESAILSYRTVFILRMSAMRVLLCSLKPYNFFSSKADKWNSRIKIEIERERVNGCEQTHTYKISKNHRFAIDSMCIWKNGSWQNVLYLVHLVEHSCSVSSLFSSTNAWDSCVYALALDFVLHLELNWIRF